MWKKVFQYFLRRFQMANGRSPMTAAEMNQIQSETVNWINKTGGKTLPGTPQSQKPPFQGFTPRVIEGGKGKAGIGTLLKDSPEAIAKIKAENKAAAERLRNKKKTVEDFRDDGDFDPGGMASGGLARVGMAGGKLVLEGLKKLVTKKYAGKIDDDLLQKMLVDDDPQRLSEVMATIDEALIMQNKGMKPDAIMDTFKESFKRKKQAKGGLAHILGV